MSTPWPPEMTLALGRDHVEEGPFNGVYLAGLPDGCAVVPCFESPRATAAMLGLQILSGKLPEVEWLVFIADSYHAAGTDRDDLPDSLQEAFIAGDPRVSEAITVLCMCPDGPSYQATQMYVREEDEIDWGEIDVQRDLSGLDGAVAGLMSAVLAARSGSIPEAADHIGGFRVEL